MLLDDRDVQGAGGTLYTAYGVPRELGALVLVRPDGYVGAVAPLERADVLEAYFARFALL